MIIEIDGVTINGNDANVVLVGDTEGTIDLEMPVEILDQLLESICRAKLRVDEARDTQ